MTVVVYGLLMVVGLGAFLFPFWLPAEALPSTAHAADAPLVTAVVAALAVAAVTLEVRRGVTTGATVAVLGVLSASAGLLGLLDLPGGGNGVFFLVVLAGAALGPRLGLLLGLCAMATAAVLTGGIGPWLPFQMLGLGWIGGGAGLVGRFTAGLPARAEVVTLAAYGWACGFAYGALLNLWFWPYVRGEGPTAWSPELSLAETLEHYRSFYALTSFGWDAAGALANAVLILLTGRAVLGALRRVGGRLDPVVELDDPQPPVPSATGATGRSSSAMRLSMPLTNLPESSVE